MPPSRSQRSHRQPVGNCAIRALTEPTERLPFLASGVPFRRYNETYEKWLAHRHSDKIKPYTQKPSHFFDIYLTEYAASMRLDIDGKTCAITERLKALADKPQLLAMMASVWKEIGQAKREEFVLAVWEDMCRRSEQRDYIWSREDCPELTLEWATGLDKDGVGNWIRLWAEQGKPVLKGKGQDAEDGLPYHNLRNEKWDRVNGVLDIESASTPVKKSIRAFVHDGVARRNYHLRQFIEELYAEIGCIGLEMMSTKNNSSSSTKISADEKEMMERLRASGIAIGVTEDETKLTQKEQIASISCSNCHAPPTVKKVSLQCSRCKTKVGRIVNYCSRECQLQEWPRHKRICGKNLTDTSVVPSFATTPSAQTNSTTSSSTTSLITSSTSSSTASTTLPSTKGADSSAHHSSLTSSASAPAEPAKSPTLPSTTSITTSSARLKWRNLLVSTSYCYWAHYLGDPLAFNPSEPLEATPIDVPIGFESRVEIRRTICYIAAKFLDHQNERACDLLIAVLVAVHAADTTGLIRSIQWIGKLRGLEGEDINIWVKNEIWKRREQGFNQIMEDESLKVIKLYIVQIAASLEPEKPDPSYHAPSLIRQDLDSNPSIIWCMTDPEFPMSNLKKQAIVISGPQLIENPKSKFVHTRDELILTKALRSRTYRVLENPREDFDSLGILMLALADGSIGQERILKWIFWRVSQDLDVPEELLKVEMERMRVEVAGRQGAEWDQLREGLKILKERRAVVKPEQYPPLSFYPSSAPSADSDIARPTMSTPSSSGAHTSDASSTMESTKSKSKKKKKGKAT